MEEMPEAHRRMMEADLEKLHERGYPRNEVRRFGETMYKFGIIHGYGLSSKETGQLFSSLLKIQK